MMNIQKTATVAAIACLAAQVAAAAEPEEITVSASPLGTTLQPARVLQGDELMIRRAPTIGETLEAELGVSGSYFGPAASRPIIRGQGGPRVQVLTGGISTLDVADVSADHAVSIEPVLAERIEIIRGPSTLLFGSQAAGGIVNVEDGRIPQTRPDDAFDALFEVRGDTATGEQALVGRADIDLGPLVLHLDGVTRETDDIDIPGFATADPTARPDDESSGTLRNSASETDSYTAGLSWVFDQGFAGVAVNRLENRYGLPGPKEEEGDDDEPELFPGPFLDLEQTRIDLRGERRFDDRLIEKVRWSAGINNYEHTEIEPSGEPATLFENDAWQGRIELVHRAVAGLNGAVGLQLDDRDFSAFGEEAFVAPVDTQSWGLFAIEQMPLDWGTLEFGLRADVLKHEPAELRGYDDTAVSAAAGLTVPFAEEFEFYGNLARTERHPAAEELYSDGAHLATRLFEIGLLSDDPAAAGRADKEISLNIDAGMRRISGPLQFEAGFFLNSTDDYIFLDLTGDIEDDLPVAVYRQADAEFWGIEAEVQLSLAEDSLLAPRLRLFGDFTEAELDNGEDLPRIPPLRVGIGAGVGPLDVWGLDLDVIYYADQDDISSFQTDSYTMVNIGGWYRLPVGEANVELFARATNLLDEDARRSTSFLAGFAPLPGASLTAGARVQF